MSLNLIDLSSRTVINLPLVDQGLDGESITIKELIAKVEARLTKDAGGGETAVRVLSAAVGKKRVNICHKKHSLRYFLLDADPWFINTISYDTSLGVDLTITEAGDEYGCGSEATIRVDLEVDRVKDLKQKFSLMTGLDMCDIQFTIKNGRETLLLNNQEKLEHYMLEEGSHISYVPRRKYMVQGIPLENISDMILHAGKLAALSPVWRRVTPGLWIEGVCMNKLCVACSEIVVMNQGFTDLDYINERHRCKCPMCYEPVTPTCCGFNRCEWMLVGLKRSPGKGSRIMRRNWQRVDKKDGYHRFCPNGHADWLNLKILSRSLNYSDTLCVLCMKNLWSPDCVQAKCGHQFHASCLHLFGHSSNFDNCLECFACNNMTPYQKLYSITYNDELITI